MTQQPPDRVCRVCREGLNPLVDPTGILHYVHTFTDVGHDAEPGPPEEVIGRIERCDFCAAEAPPWEFEVPPHLVTARRPDGTFIEVQDDGLWGACDRCADLVERQDRKALLRASRGSSPAIAEARQIGGDDMAASVVAFVKAQHDAFFEFNPGPRRASTT